MLQTKEVAENYIKHPNPNYRIVAVTIIQDHWKPDEKFAAICEELATVDVDVGVRCAAITFLGVYYDSTGNRKIGQFLARMVETPSNLEFLKKSAYIALWQLARGGYSLYGNMLMSPGTMQFPVDVDWSL